MAFKTAEKTTVLPETRFIANLYIVEFSVVVFQVFNRDLIII